MPSSTSGKEPAARAFEPRGTRIADAALLNLAGFIAPILVGLATLPFILRLLGTERFGILSLVWIVGGYFGFIDLGLSPATTKFAADALGRGDRASLPAILWSSAALQGGLGIAAAGLLVASSSFLVRHVFSIPTASVAETELALVLVGVTIPLSLWIGAARGVLEAGQRFAVVNAVKSASNAAAYLFSLGAAAVGGNLALIIGMHIVVRTATLGVYAVVLAKIFPGILRPIFDRTRARRMLGFGGWAAVSSFAWPFFFHLDRLLLGVLTGMRAVGYYTPPFEIINRLGIIPASVWMTFFPAMSTLHARNETNRQARLVFRSIKALLLAAGSVAVLAIGLGPAFLRVWVGGEFAAHGGIALQILAVGFLADSLSIVPLGLLQGSGRTDVPGRIHIGELVLYIPAAYFLIRAFGLPGAAAAWTLQSIANALLLFLAARPYYSDRCPADLKTGLERAAAACGFFAAAILASAPLGAGRIGMVLAAGVFAGAVWRWVLDREERTWLVATLMRMAPRKTRS